MERLQFRGRPAVDLRVGEARLELGLLLVERFDARLRLFRRLAQVGDRGTRLGVQAALVLAANRAANRSAHGGGAVVPRRRLGAAAAAARRAALLLQVAPVVLQVALEGRDRAVRDQPQAVGDEADQVRVVGHQHDRAGVGVERLHERLARVHVEMVARLVEEQHLRRLAAHEREQQARPLAAREAADLELGVVVAEAEAAQLGAQPRLVRVRQDAREQLQRRRREVELLGLVLGEITDLQLGGLDQAPALGREAAGQELHEGRFAVAVGAQERDPVVHVEAQVEAGEHVSPGRVTGARALQGDERRGERPGRREVEGHRARFHDAGDRLHALERLDARLGLARLAGLVAEALDEGLDVPALGLLAGAERRLVRQALAPGALETVVVA